VHQIIHGSVGYKVLTKIPCPVLVMFLCRGWLSAAGVFELGTRKFSPKIV